MEHRHYPRQRADLQVEIHAAGRLLGVVPGIEISPSGMCIPDTGLDLKNNQLVTVTFIGTKEPHSTQAMVIHNKVGKIGLMFADIVALDRIMAGLTDP